MLYLIAADVPRMLVIDLELHLSDSMIGDAPASSMDQVSLKGRGGGKELAPHHRSTLDDPDPHSRCGDGTSMYRRVDGPMGRSRRSHEDPGDRRGGERRW